MPSSSPSWLKRRIKSFDLFSDYLATVRHTWVDVAWGAGLPAIGFIIWWSLGNPPQWVVVCFFVWALLIAGYYSWRVDHLRLMPRFEIGDFHLQLTPTTDPVGNPTGQSVFIQLLPKCLTEAEVEECQGHLRSVYRWSEKRQWELTELNETVLLGWSHGDAVH
jgi:hypothetical protein